MPNATFLGPVERQPITITNKKCAGAYLPCTLVTEGATTLTQATAHSGNLLVLSYNTLKQSAFDTSTSPLNTAYATTDIAVAYEPEPGQEYGIAMAAATYTYGQELTVAASGRLAAASSGNVVFAVTRFAGALSAGDIGKVKIVNHYAKA